MILKFIKNKNKPGLIEIYEVTTIRSYPYEGYIYFTRLGNSYEDSKEFNNYEEIWLDKEKLK